MGPCSLQDYMYLNALTLKGKILIPVFDKLMDELARQVGSQLWICVLVITKSD